MLCGYHVWLQLNSFNEFIVSNVDGLNGDFDHASRVWSGVDIVATLTHTGVGPSSFHHLQVNNCWLVLWMDRIDELADKLMID